MRVLVLSFYYEPDLCAGSFRSTALVKRLQDTFPEQTEFHVLTTLPNRYKSYRQKALSIEEQGNVTIYRFSLPSHKSGFLDQAFSFFVYAQRVLRFVIRNDYHVVFATSSRLMTSFLGALVSVVKRAPLYLDIRDLFVDTLNDVFSKKKNFFIAPILKLIERFSFSRAKKINIVSKGFEPYFRSRYPQVPLCIIPNGIDDIFFESIIDKDILLDDFGKKKVLYAGNIGEGQGLHRIVPELAQIFQDEFHFYIVGDGGKREALSYELKKKGCKNVSLLKPVHRDQLKSYYAQADVLFLHLNSYKAFEKVLPSKIFEYAVYSRPILAGVSGYASEFLQNEVKGSFVFYPCDAQKAAKILKNLDFESQESYQRQNFIKNYSRAYLMQKLAEDILSIAQKELT